MPVWTGRTFFPSFSLLGSRVCMILFYSRGLGKIAGPPSLVIFARAMSPLPGPHRRGLCADVGRALPLLGIMKRDFGGRLLMATVDAKTFQCHLL